MLNSGTERDEVHRPNSFNVQILSPMAVLTRVCWSAPVCDTARGAQVHTWTIRRANSHIDINSVQFLQSFDLSTKTENIAEL